MKLIIDSEKQEISRELDGHRQTTSLYSKEAFEWLSEQWLKVGWNQKYTYTFTWLGRPIIQLPEDMVRLQEVIYLVKPEVIIETGVAHGGSLVFYASLCRLIGRGRVIGVDVEIRPHNRKALEEHELYPLISLIEGDSVAPATIQEVRSHIAEGETVLVILDSNHSRAHVAAELEAYHDLVTPGSYIVATDGIMTILHDVPRGQPAWREDNPASAAKSFAQQHPEFVIEQPPWPFSESELEQNVTHWPYAWLRRLDRGPVRRW
jgi:cephalosporin hydroxylase